MAVRRAELLRQVRELGTGSHERLEAHLRGMGEFLAQAHAAASVAEHAMTTTGGDFARLADGARAAAKRLVDFEIGFAAPVAAKVKVSFGQLQMEGYGEVSAQDQAFQIGFCNPANEAVSPNNLSCYFTSAERQGAVVVEPVLPMDCTSYIKVTVSEGRGHWVALGVLGNPRPSASSYQDPTFHGLACNGQRYKSGEHVGGICLPTARGTYLLRFDPLKATLTWKQVETAWSHTEQVSLAVAPEWRFHINSYDRGQVITIVPLQDGDLF